MYNIIKINCESIVLITILIVIGIILIVGIVFCCKNKLDGGRFSIDRIGSCPIIDTTSCDVNGELAMISVCVDREGNFPMPYAAQIGFVKKSDEYEYPLYYLYQNAIEMKNKDSVVYWLSFIEPSARKNSRSTWLLLNNEIKKDLINDSDNDIYTILSQHKIDVNIIKQTLLKLKGIPHYLISKVGQLSDAHQYFEIEEAGWRYIVPPYIPNIDTVSDKSEFREWFRRDAINYFYKLYYTPEFTLEAKPANEGKPETYIEEEDKTLRAWHIADIIPASYRHSMSYNMKKREIPTDVIATWNFMCELVNIKAACMMIAGLNMAISDEFYVHAKKDIINDDVISFNSITNELYGYCLDNNYSINYLDGLITINKLLNENARFEIMFSSLDEEKIKTLLDIADEISKLNELNVSSSNIINCLIDVSQSYEDLHKYFHATYIYINMIDNIVNEFLDGIVYESDEEYNEKTFNDNICRMLNEHEFQSISELSDDENVYISELALTVYAMEEVYKKYRNEFIRYNLSNLNYKNPNELLKAIENYIDNDKFDIDDSDEDFSLEY